MKEVGCDCEKDELTHCWTPAVGVMSSMREEKKKKKKKNMQSVLVMFVAGLHPSWFQQPSENPTRLFVCFNVCVCWEGATALLIVEAEQCCCVF